MKTNANGITPIDLKSVTIGDGFWGGWIGRNRAVTLAAEYQQLRTTGRIDAWKLDWTQEKPHKPHYFWDSDVAKWIEAVAYSLATHPDAELEHQVDQVVDLIEQAQGPDGYLNIYFTAVAPEQRWSNLRDWHELYCAGHLMEAAVAYYESTGKRQLLDVLQRYADYIDQIFGPREGQMRGYPGHQEIELALVKLYRATGEPRYLDLAKFFIDERGQQPHYFDVEAQKRGEDPANYYQRTHRYTQSHLPVREQTSPVGHAVRACYMYAGMADVAAETGDQTLADACKRLWRSLTEKQMYLTGGIGPSRFNEGFTFDYDLPNETAYAETCAAIALVFWAHRMLHLELDGRYADVMERALYNGVLSGVSLDGTRFFYANPLAAYPGVSPHNPQLPTLGQRESYRRSDWFDCACCPPNIARLLASLGRYVYSRGQDQIHVHLYMGSDATFQLGARAVRIEQRGYYPWAGMVHLKVEPDAPARFTLFLRLPGWCPSPELELNGAKLDLPSIATRGYAAIDREWQPGDRLALALPMPVQRVTAHPNVRQNAGCVALQRGPIVYCLEEVDNGPDLASVVLPQASDLSAAFDDQLLGGVVRITGQALRPDPADWQGGLYRPTGPQALQPFTFTAIPYCLWANREPGEMRVWIRTDR